MVDWDGLENRCALARTVGSNPTPSAILLFCEIQYGSKTAESIALSEIFSSPKVGIVR